MDLGSIPGTPNCPESCQDWSLSTELGVSPEHHRYTSKQNKKVFLNYVIIILVFKGMYNKIYFEQLVNVTISHYCTWIYKNKQRCQPIKTGWRVLPNSLRQFKSKLVQSLLLHSMHVIYHSLCLLDYFLPAGLGHTQWSSGTISISGRPCSAGDGCKACTQSTELSLMPLVTFNKTQNFPYLYY